MCVCSLFDGLKRDLFSLRVFDILNSHFFEKSPLRLGVKDAAFSRWKYGFKSHRGYGTYRRIFCFKYQLLFTTLNLLVLC